IGNYERRGKLHPRYAYRADSRGIEHRVAVYDPNELVKLPHPYNQSTPSRDPGEIAAQAFELFREGKTDQEVVIKLRATPDAIEVLRSKWLDMGGADIVIGSHAKEALEKLVGPFKDVAELVEIVTKLKERLPAPQAGAPA